MVALLRKVLTITKAPAGFPFDPTLAVAVLRVLDVLAGVEQSVSIEAVVDVTGVRDIASSDDSHEAIVLPNPHLPSVRSTGSPCRSLCFLFSQQALDLLV